jgi:hypothetical protein
MIIKAGICLDNYLGNICHCLEAKGLCAHFCKDCLSKLPPYLTMKLGKPIGHGYEEAYDSCVEFLTKKV